MRDDKTSHHLIHLTLYTVFTVCLLAGKSASAQEASGQKPGKSHKTAELARATELDARARELYRKGRYDEAMSLAREILAIREKFLGAMHPDIAESLADLAMLHHVMGEYDKALPLYERHANMREQELGADHPDVAPFLNNRAELHRARGEYDKALLLHTRALSIREKAVGPDHPDVARSLNNLAGLHYVKGEHDKAQLLWKRALAIREKALGPEHPDVATSLNDLAVLHHTRGEYGEALPMYERALRIQEKALGPEHPDVATALSNLAILHRLRGEYDKALRLHERASSIREKRFGLDHPDVAVSLNHLAMLHHSRGEYDEALRLYERALSIREKALGPDHPDVARSLNNLVMLHMDMGEYEFLPLQERALSIDEKALGPEHPDVANFLSNLALLHYSRGEYDKALPLYERGLSIRAKMLGPYHLEVAISLNSLAVLHAARDHIPTAIGLFERALRIRTRILGQWLHGGSEYQRHRRMASFTRHVYTFASLHLSMAPKHPRAARLALESIISYKSRILDAMADTMRAAHLDADPDTHAMLDELRDAQAGLSHLYLQSPGADQAGQERYRRRRVELESRIDELQAKLSAKSETSRRLIEPVTVDALQERLPGDAALLEFFVYKPRDFKATGPAAAKPWGEPRYAAYIVRPGGPVHGVDLGPAQVIDEAVARLRASFARYDKHANQRARELYALVMQPLREHLGDVARLYLAPAGQLSFVPFAALMDEHGHYLVERTSISYLASGRDLVQRPRSADAPARDAQPVTIVADPTYGLPAAAEPLAKTSATGATEFPGAATEHRRSRDAAQIGQVEALSGTRREAEILRALWPRSEVWTQAAATETAVKNVHSPRILHLATHGFFLADQDLDTMADLSANDISLQADLYGRLGVGGHRAPVENGLLRSGLLLAGANQFRDPTGDNDGILTALEVSAMNLAGTRLAVLSACDTGIGADGPNQGVYGLRRAFAIAGAETLVMSLWKVDDNATQDLMARYYAYLLDGEGRAEAMRRVQLDYLAQGGNRAHPYYWASFVVSGDDSTMAGRPPRLTSIRAGVRKGGCAGCNTGDAGAGGLWLCVLVLAAVSTRSAYESS